ncbi:phosphoribosylanthranilate isomerase [Aestuariibaculum marinum]|uniref:N-(5'-phosphoribosyl)anthranilate isomerase n=1 Tax=Aestuariibaculum marinum TaxID=2683592 RepID=A0A8J6PY95_9FLAO|nr:phosphoribosylanthranilate isomerase [Aestuariibaculum marinum]MBD0824281.1 phosphoribosylanthranilate isomerase [Aestuariibaculum marinum]
MKLKVCGMKYQDNIQAVADLQPDYLGFIFYEKSARYFNTSIPDISKNIKKTGVFVNETVEFVLEQIQKHDLQAVQLHGNESPEYCKQLKNCHAELVSASLDNDLKHPQFDKSLEIVKVFSIKDEFNFEVLTPYEQVCDYFLFDTKGKLPGGNGYTFDWNVLNDYPSTKPFFLSGGIGLDEADKLNAFKQSPASKYCYAIDVNSKFEIEPGLKDIEQLKQFKANLSFRT